MPQSKAKAHARPAPPRAVTLNLDERSLAWLDGRCAARAGRTGENPARLRSVLVRELLLAAGRGDLPAIAALIAPPAAGPP